MVLNITYMLIMYTVISIGIVSVYLYYNLHHSDQFKVLIDLIAAILGFLTIVALLMRASADNASARNIDSEIYDNIITELFTDTIDIFIENPDMQYFFDEIFNNAPRPSNNTNELKEQMICFRILSNIGNYAMYYYSHVELPDYTEQLESHNGRVIKIILQFKQSNSFNNALDKYNSDYSGLEFAKYMNEFFAK